MSASSSAKCPIPTPSGKQLKVPMPSSAPWGPSMDPRATGLPLVEGTRHILETMNLNKVTRYIGHGTPSIQDTSEQSTAQTRLIRFMGRFFLKRAYKELLGMTDLIKRSGLNWTIVRFTAPQNRPKPGHLRVGFYGTNKIGFTVSRADVAAFTASQVDDDAYIGRAPAISN